MVDRLLRYTEITWSEILTPGDSPIGLCYRKNIPAYIKFDKTNLLVYRHYHPSELVNSDVNVFPREGVFSGELTYLRIDDQSLEDIAVTGSTEVTKFSCGGLSITKALALEDVGFRHIELIDRRRWDLAKKRWEMVREWPSQIQEMAKSSLKGESPSVFQGEPSFYSSVDMQRVGIREDKVIVPVRVNESDLFFHQKDIESLREDIQRSHESIDYPFSHQQLMPALYWMFQAAHLLNGRKSLAKSDVKKWLKSRAPNTFRHKTDRVAEKFILPTCDRKKGGTPRREFDLSRLSEEDRADYKFTFTSPGLTFILVVADWWATMMETSPDQPRWLLAKRLDENFFSEDEVEDLVYLISGEALPDTDRALFKQHLKAVGRGGTTAD